MEILLLYTETCTNPKRAREVFREMRDLGVDAVIVCVYEQDLLRWKKDMPRLFDEAANAGLRRYISYGRYGGTFSGGLMVPSMFTFLHPDSVVIPGGDESGSGGEADVSKSGFFQRISCVNHPGFRAYMEEQTKDILTRFNPEGLLFDEPKGLQLPCSCKHCRIARRNDETCEQANLRFQVEFVRNLADQAKAHRADLTTMIVVGHHDDDALAAFAKLPSMDVLGTEAYWVNRGKDMKWMREWCPGAIQKLRTLGKKTQIWAGNFGLSKEHQEDLTEAYRIMAEAKPDQLAGFWWWRGSDDPERVMELTRNAISEVRSRAIHRAPESKTPR